MTIVADNRDFIRSIRAVQRATKRDFADVLNRAQRNVALKAFEETKKANPGTIEADLKENQLALKIVSRQLHGKIGSVVTIKRGKNAGKTRKITRVTRKQIGAAAKRLIEKRKRGARFLAVGWLPAAGRRSGTRRGGLASKGYVIEATPSKLVGEIANASFDALKGPAQAASTAMMTQALSKAVKKTARDNETYALAKVNGTLVKFSD